MPSRFLAFRFTLALTLLVLSIRSSASAQTEIPGVGSWKLNVAKSKLGNEPPPQSVTSKIEAIDGHAVVIGVMIGFDGIRTEAKYRAKIDGKDYKITGHSNADTVALKQIDARTIERVDKKAGKIVETSVTVYSLDGKSSTTTGKAKNARGADFEYVVVNERIP